MKLNAHWALRVYPNLKGQSGKNVWKIFQKEQARPEKTQRTFINHKPNQKLDLEWTMNGLENQFRVNIKHETVNIEVKLPHLKKNKNQIAASGQKPKPAHSALKLEWKHFKPQNNSLFFLNSLWGDQT